MALIKLFWSFTCLLFWCKEMKRSRVCVCVCVCLTLCRCICFRLQEPWVIPGVQMKNRCLQPEQDMLYIKLVLTNMSYRAPEILTKGGACFMVHCSRNVSQGTGPSAGPWVPPERWHVLTVCLTTASMSNTSRLNLHSELCTVHVQCLRIGVYNGADFIRMIERRICLFGFVWGHVCQTKFHTSLKHWRPLPKIYSRHPKNKRKRIRKRRRTPNRPQRHFRWKILG